MLDEMPTRVMKKFLVNLMSVAGIVVGKNVMTLS